MPIIIYIFSCVGGYPVGAKLIEKAYRDNTLTKKQCETMLGYCVNPGPSFIIIAVGSGMLSSVKIGCVLFISCILGSTTIALFSKRTYANDGLNVVKSHTTNFSDKFVSATYEGIQAMISICAFIILFSSNVAKDQTS